MAMGQQVIQKIKEAGLSLTQARTEILSFLMKEHGPHSAEDIMSALPAGTCDLATIYRTLTLFESQNLVKRCNLGEGIDRFEFLQEKTHHHHFLCRICKEIKSIHYCVVAEFEKLFQDMGYRDIEHQLEFTGICPRCTSRE